MALQPIPVSRYLVPQEKPEAPEGFTVVQEKLARGLPQPVQLDAETQLTIRFPTGLAVSWRDADPTQQVSTSESELAPFVPQLNEPFASAHRTLPRLFVRRAGVMLAVLPLVAGVRRIVSETGDAARGTRLELIVLSWDIRAGSVRGPGDFGSRITFAWRLADQAVAQFSTPPIDPMVQTRVNLIMPLKLRIESTLGLKKKTPLARFQMKKVVLK